MFPLHKLTALLPVHSVASVNRNIATVDDGAHSVSTPMMLIEVKRLIRKRYGHRILVGRIGIIGFGPCLAKSDERYIVGYILAEIVDVVV
jgi:hypothetical protein